MFLQPLGFFTKEAHRKNLNCITSSLAQNAPWKDSETYPPSPPILRAGVLRSQRLKIGAGRRVREPLVLGGVWGDGCPRIYLTCLL